ncbi:MAG TPA: HAMP domain-containing sensor histidine kinase [Gaiellaceae bacterium]|nr:HAMP domain-containing sensor histidine kinase [Gaiellaceae bacterium]
MRLRRRDTVAEDLAQLQLEAARAHHLVEESREILVVLDRDRCVIAASRRARESLEGLADGAPFPEAAAQAGGRTPLEVTYSVDGHQETLVYVSAAGEVAAYEELRAGFTAAVSHELRTPLARLLALLESASLPGADPQALIADARDEVDRIRELIDDVLFVSELESGRAVVSLGSIRALPVLEGVFAELAPAAERAGIRLELECAPSFAVPLRQRMLQVIAQNLALNAIRYAGDGSTFTFACREDDRAYVIVAEDDGVGVAREDVPRLFERFYRSDRARASRGTGLGLAIVKHIITAAGGTVEARSAPGAGLRIECRFPRG